MTEQKSAQIACDILILGGGTGGTAAALAAAQAGASVCLLEETDWLGGQLTTQGVCTPDEHGYIETFGGTRRYTAFRETVRAHYRAHYRLTPEAAANPHLNPGNCWVSRLSFEPKVGAEILRQMTRPLEESGRLRIFTRARAVACETEEQGVGCWVLGVGGNPVQEKGERRKEKAQLPNTQHPTPLHITEIVAQTEEGAEMRFAPRYVLDATELGDGLVLCGEEGIDWVVGAESKAETGEPDAPETARPEWVQPFTFPFALDWSPETVDTNVITPPEDYEELKALQKYHVIHGAITGLFAGRLPWWRYRRVLAKENFDDPRITSDLAMINTAGNDYYGGNILGADAGTEEDIQATLARARHVSLGYLYWLQTECPRENPEAGGVGCWVLGVGEEQGQGARDQRLGARSQGLGESPITQLPNYPITQHPTPNTQHPCGYPEFRLRRDVFGTPDGCAIRPYIRESRRIKALRPILEQEIVVKDFRGNGCRGENARAAFMPDSVGVGHYALDIHPNGHGEPNAFVATRPFQIPLGALIPTRLENLLPACKNLGTTHLTNGAYRLHPIEWNIGESAGLLAAFCLRTGRAPREVSADGEAQREFQATLLREGVPLYWFVDVPQDHPAFEAVQTLALAGVPLGSKTDLLFRPDEPIAPEEWNVWRDAIGKATPTDFTGTRAEAVLALFAA